MPAIIKHNNRPRAADAWRDKCHQGLFPYQRVGVDFLAGRPRAILADGMGLGKTVQAIRAMDQVKAQHVLIITTAAMRRQWAVEIDRWSVIRRSVTVVERIADVRLLSTPMTLIVSWQLAAKAVGTLAEQGWDVVICDEAQAAKNPASKRTQALYGRQCLAGGIVEGADRVWLLSGELAPNDASELFPHIARLWPRSIPGRTSPGSFLAHFCTFRETIYGRQVTGNKNVDELRFILRPVRLRRTAEQVLKELPALNWSDLSLDVPTARRAIECRPDADAFEELLKACQDDAEAGQLISSQSTHLSVLRREIGMVKAPAVVDLVASELTDAPTDKVIVFAWHLSVIDALMEGLRAFKPVAITGSVNPATRQASIASFQSDPTCRVFIGQISAAGVGLTLTAANQVVFAETSWSPGDLVQAAKRAHRIGQERPVFARVVSLAGSIDEAVNKVLSRKARMISQLNDDDE